MENHKKRVKLKKKKTENFNLKKKGKSQANLDEPHKPSLI
jgi:hypothetical protein